MLFFFFFLRYRKKRASYTYFTCFATCLPIQNHNHCILLCNDVLIVLTALAGQLATKYALNFCKSCSIFQKHFFMLTQEKASQT